jgi:hypothetical protein
LNPLFQADGQLNLGEVESSAVSINAMITEDHGDTSNSNFVYYDVKNFEIVISNRIDLCPTEECKYSFINENKEGFRLDNSTGLMIHGLLKAVNESESNTFEIFGYFNVVDPTEQKVEGGQELVDGTVQFYNGDDALGGEYPINGSITWKNERDADLSLKGQL